MKSVLRLSILLVFFAAGVFVLFSRGSQAVNITSEGATSESVSNPRALYQKNCARCHGADGKSETESGKLFDAPDLTSEDTRNASSKKIARVITKGASGMPAFGKKLKASEIASLVAYVRSL